MKKVLLLIASTILLQSCATIFGGGITECQKVRPKQGKRMLRPAPFVADILLGYGVGLIVDFANGSIYKPCRSDKPMYNNSISNVVAVNSTSKDELYNRAKKWTAERFKSAKDVIQLDDKGNGKIIIKGCLIYEAPAFNPGTAYGGAYYFMFSVDCKDDKYKYSFTNPYFEPFNRDAFAASFTAKKIMRKINETEWNALRGFASNFEDGMKSPYQPTNW